MRERERESGKNGNVDTVGLLVEGTISICVDNRVPLLARATQIRPVVATR